MKNLRAHKGRVAATVIAATVLFSPSALMAGSYGSTAVTDAPVSNQMAQGMVWCERLDANVTESLFRQMDCGSAAGIASPAVAGERVTNPRGPIARFFERFPHTPRNTPNGSDDGNRVISTSGTPTGVPITPGDGQPSTPPTGVPTTPGDGQPSTPPTGVPTTPGDGQPTTETSRVTKWERMNELGVTRETYRSQDKEFLDQAKDFRRNKAPGADWSDFNPN